ncbi:GRAM domain-containing protein [Clostridium grantii]|uniref:GRAM domain-containing protein n=1 Tax=Clostridium grantii DSM 8605 TaxID=1121316 RepID=A0A1M5WWA6_9CLOT|nr:GRAM domain-containing protein [Clostridium grantii]SHH91877.1 GRAM domain-containing protein [Clostridium grantii DSM 8605]
MANKKELLFKLSDEQEKIVRIYECTLLRKIIGGKSKGELYVTNKRVIYGSEGKSIRGKSIYLNEMPIEDVSGMKFYMGTDIGIVKIIILSIFIQLLSTPIFMILPDFISHWFFGIIIMVPFVLSCIVSADLLSESAKNNLASNLKAFNENGVFRQVISNNNTIIMKGAFFIGIFILVNYFIRDMLILKLCMMAIIIFFTLGRKQVFSFTLFSKTSKGTGMYLPGKLITIKETTAMDTLEAGPARDAEILIKELGALIMDINKFGELGVEKWIK